MHGRGRYEWADGRIYDGEYIDDLKDGEGTFHWADGRRFHGQWKDGKQHGVGVFRAAHGEQRTGQWREGVRQCWLEEATKDQAPEEVDLVVTLRASVMHNGSMLLTCTPNRQGAEHQQAPIPLEVDRPRTTTLRNLVPTFVAALGADAVHARMTVMLDDGTTLGDRDFDRPLTGLFPLCPIFGGEADDDASTEDIMTSDASDNYGKGPQGYVGVPHGNIGFVHHNSGVGFLDGNIGNGHTGIGMVDAGGDRRHGSTRSTIGVVDAGGNLP